jgi:hypothetical protein
MRHILLLLVTIPLLSQAQEKDSIAAAETKDDNRNVMLDASASAKPRDIPIGLPGETGGTTIIEDGLPVATTWSPLYPYVHWAGSSSYSNVDLMGVEETVLRTGVLGFSVNSYTALGTDKLHGKFAAKTNNDGLINVDANLNGPLAKGWYFTVGAYANLDPTSVHPKHVTFVNNTQIYKAGLTHRWNQSEASLLYKLTVNHDGLFGCDRAPFIYNGDGSISKLNDFRMGRDSYMPTDTRFSYMDLETGQLHDTDINNENRRFIHDLTFMMDNKLNNRWSIDSHVHLSGTKNMAMIGFSETGIDEIVNGFNAKGNHITTVDGKDYSGLMQQRLLFAQHFDFFDMQAQSELVNKSRNALTHLGISYWFTYQYARAANVTIAQTVENDPSRLLNDGNRQWGYNSSANYGRGREHFMTLYAIDDRKITHKLGVYYGLRAELFHSDYDMAVNQDGQTNNTRHDGFYINDGIVTVTNHKRTKFNITGVARANYQLAPRLFFTGEYIYSNQQQRFDQFRFETMPIDKPYVKQLMRFGVSYENKWLRLSTMFSYINSRNIGSTQYFTKQIGGVSETQGKNTTYDIGTKGITVDATILYGNFTMHTSATYQEPKYRNFSVPLTFSDGSEVVLDYNGNYVTGMSKVLLELDPSYRIGDWRLWLSARYYSRQYASLVNNVYFDGHWETFAGLDWNTTKRLMLQLSITNLLNQSGANGTISAANTITDISQLKGYYTAGTFIRPFTVSLSATYKF